MAERAVGGLKWVKGEIGATLRRVTALVEAYQRTGEPAPLGDAVDALFEVRAVLLALQLTLPARLVDEMQRLCDAMADRQVTSPKEAAEAMMLALIQLPNHLDRLDAGAEIPPLNLWPTINDLRESRGAPPLTPAELLVPGSVLAEEDGSLPPEALEALASTLRKVRPHFHRALVAWYRPTSGGGGLDKLGRLFHQLHRYLKEGILADLFRLADGYVIGLHSGDVAGGPIAQALIGRLDRVFKPLANSPPQWPDLDIRDLIDAFLAQLVRAGIQLPVVAEMQSRYGHAAALTRSAQGVPDALAGLAASLLDELATDKERLDLFVRGERADRTPLDEIRASLRNLARTLDAIDAGSLSERLRALGDGFGDLAMADAGEDVLRLEPLAAELLGIEAELQGHADHCAPAAPIAEVSAPDAAGLQSETLREAHAEFAQAKDAILACRGPGADPAAFREVPDRLSSVAGALQILGDDPGAQIADDIAGLVRRRYLAPDRLPQGAEFVSLVNAVAALEPHCRHTGEGETEGDDGFQSSGSALRTLDQFFSERSAAAAPADAVSLDRSLGAVGADLAADLTQSRLSPEAVSAQKRGSPAVVADKAPADSGAGAEAVDRVAEPEELLVESASEWFEAQAAGHAAASGGGDDSALDLGDSEWIDDVDRPVDSLAWGDSGLESFDDLATALAVGDLPDLGLGTEPVPDDPAETATDALTAELERALGAFDLEMSSDEGLKPETPRDLPSSSTQGNLVEALPDLADFPDLPTVPPAATRKKPVGDV